MAQESACFVPGWYYNEPCPKTIVRVSDPILPSALLAFAPVDNRTGLAHQFLQRARLAEFLHPIGGRNVNQNAIHEQNRQRCRSSEPMENRFKCFNVQPLIDIDHNWRWAQIQRIHEGPELARDCRRLPTHRTPSMHVFSGERNKDDLPSCTSQQGDSPRSLRPAVSARLPLRLRACQNRGSAEGRWPGKHPRTTGEHFDPVD